MDAMTTTAARANRASTTDRVRNDREAPIFTRNGEQPVVMMSLGEDKALEETARLLCAPVNAKRTLPATGQLSSGKGLERRLTR